MPFDPFVPACYQVLRERKTGVMRVAADAVETLLYFRGGTLVFAEAGGLGETLGRLLVAQGRISLEQYTTILEHLTVAYRDRREIRFGDVAVQLGFLTPEQVHEALAAQVTRKFVHCMEWEECVCTFTNDPEQVACVPHFPCAFEPLILEGVRAHSDDRRCAKILDPIAELWPSLRADAGEVAKQFRLDGRAFRLLRMIDGERQVRDLLDAAPAGEQTREVLVALAVANALRFVRRSVAPPAPPPPRSEVRAPTIAQPNERRRARTGEVASGATGARQAAPEGEDDSSVVILLPLPRPVQEIVHAAGTSPPRPASADDRQARVGAEAAYLLGRGLLAKEEWGPALLELRRAYEQAPGELEYELAVKWAEFRVGITGESDWRGKRAALRDLARRVIAQDRRCAVAHHALGHLDAVEGQNEAAAQSLRTALRYEPDNRDAKRQLRLLTVRRIAHTPLPPTRESRSAEQAYRQQEAAVVARTAGKVDDAITLLRRARAAEPGNAGVAAELALALLKKDPTLHSREANALAREARRADPSQPLPYVVLGHLLEAVGERDRARQMYVHALTLDPECVEAQEAVDGIGR